MIPSPTTAHDIAFNRITSPVDGEEGFRAKPYNDKTGETVTCQPNGNLTWLYGLNLEVSGTEQLGQMIVHYLLEELENSLRMYGWYTQLSEVRKSVILDVAFNEGMGGLLEFKLMINALEAQDYTAAELQLLDSKAAHKLPARYTKLGNELATGVLS